MPVKDDTIPLDDESEVSYEDDNEDNGVDNTSFSSPTSSFFRINKNSFSWSCADDWRSLLFELEQVVPAAMKLWDKANTGLGKTNALVMFAMENNIINNINAIEMYDIV